MYHSYFNFLLYVVRPTLKGPFFYKERRAKGKIVTCASSTYLFTTPISYLLIVCGRVRNDSKSLLVHLTLRTKQGAR